LSVNLEDVTKSTVAYLRYPTLSERTKANT